MVSGTIIGASIGFPMGGVVGFFNPALLSSVYPDAWQKPYKKNVSIVFLTGGYGAVGGMVGGAVGGAISSRTIHDMGLIGGAVGGAAGGTIGAAITIYTIFRQGKLLG